MEQKHSQLAENTDDELVKGLAEDPATYHMEVQSSVQAQTFREAVEQSMRLSNEQKDAWEEGL